VHVAAPEKQQFSSDLLARRKLLFLMSLAPLHHVSASVKYQGTGDGSLSPFFSRLLYPGSCAVHVAAPEKQQFSSDLLARRKLLFLMSLAPLHHVSASDGDRGRFFVPFLPALRT
jgi:hypothetical protein